MKVRGILLAILSVGLLNTFAQGSIEGNIKDNNEEIIFSATVALYQDSNLIKGVTTDFDGYFVLENVEFGNYNIEISKVGYGTIRSKINIKDRETFVFNNELIKGVNIGPVIKEHVRETEFFRRAEPMVKIRKAEDFAETGAKEFNKLITLEASTTEDKEGNISFRGSRPGQGAYYVDGMRLDGNLDIPTAAIYSMKIYNGGIPAAYGNTTSAVIVIDTKSYNNMFE